MFDNLKDAAEGLVDKQGEAVGNAVDKAGELVDDRTGGRYSDQVQTGEERVKDALDGLDGQDDDIS